MVNDSFSGLSSYVWKMNYVGYVGRRKEVFVCAFAHVDGIAHVSDRGTLKDLAHVVTEQDLTKDPVHNGSEGFKQE